MARHAFGVPSFDVHGSATIGVTTTPAAGPSVPVKVLYLSNYDASASVFVRGTGSAGGGVEIKPGTTLGPLFPDNLTGLTFVASAGTPTLGYLYGR
jgi:hypothetical protein